MLNVKKLISSALIKKGGIILSSPLLTIISCSNFKINQELKNYYQDWYNSLSNKVWNKDQNNNFINYYCESEQQAIALYSWCSGSFWNEPLHKQQKPKNVTLTLNIDKNSHEIRGEDFKYLDSALDKANFPQDMIIYHGVEYMEIEFWDQLKDYIVKTNDGSYDYSQCIGKEITSYGFISTSLDKKTAISFFGWRPQYNDEWPTDIKEDNPLKEKVVFEISIKKGYKGAAYLADFDFAGFGNGSKENQILIKRNCKFRINEVSKEKDVNIFKVDLIQH